MYSFAITKHTGIERKKESEEDSRRERERVGVMGR